MQGVLGCLLVLGHWRSQLLPTSRKWLGNPALQPNPEQSSYEQQASGAAQDELDEHGAGAGVDIGQRLVRSSEQDCRSNNENGRRRESGRQNALLLFRVSSLHDCKSMGCVATVLS
jgi:hypothetical protein